MFFRRVSGRRPRLLCLAAALFLLLSACTPDRAPSGGGAVPSVPVQTPLVLPDPPEPAKASPYPDVPVYFDGLLTDKGYLVEDTLYLSPEAICGFFGVELKLTVSADGILLTGDGLELYAITDLEYMQANSRYLYTPYGYLIEDSRVYLPSDAVEKILGVSVLFSEDPLLAEIAGGGIVFLEGGEDYYERTFPSEDLFWLAHIINAESKDEPLAGMIGVGNVVLNRVASPNYPATVYNVVYDREFAIQFEPIATGGVLDDPEDLPVIATYLCLEGYNTVGDSLFFVNPDKGVSPWFEKELTPTVVIGLHHFYVD